jgi:DNA-binding CsgD family transcriptional regulator
VFESLALSASLPDAASPLPPILEPLREGLSRGGDLKWIVGNIVEGLGFDSFTYALSASSHPDRESRNHAWTTLANAREWVAIYDENAYVEVDPRVQDTWDRSTPYLWDQASCRGRDALTDAFLDAALRVGIGSGVLVPFHDSRVGRAGVSFNSHIAVIDSRRRIAVARSLGDCLVLALYFHDFFAREIFSKDISPAVHGLPLSRRELQCLQLAAHGMTNSDIARSLDISERTVQFHCSNILSKLNVLNRGEAIATGITMNLITL